MAAHNELGRWGEDMAVAYLQGKDYTIIERDWKSGRRDIDIIAKDETGTFIFVEVKTRRNRVFGEPEEAIDYKKMQNLQQAINHYIKYHQINGEVRFDIISIVGTTDSQAEINHIKDVALI